MYLNNIFIANYIHVYMYTHIYSHCIDCTPDTGSYSVKISLIRNRCLHFIIIHTAVICTTTEIGIVLS